MPVLADPDQVLPDASKSVRPSQIVMWLMFPVVLAIGFVIGLVVGIRQGERNTVNTNNTNTTANVSIIPNANTRVQTNTTNANTNVSNAFSNLSNSSLNGDYLRISSATQSQLDSQQQHDLDTLVDQSASVTDIVRQRDLIALKYALKAYASVEGNYPASPNGAMEKIEGGSEEVLYAALKNFYGGSYNLKVDPESPKYYYGYISNGSSFTLTGYLVSKQKAFTLTDGA